LRRRTHVVNHHIGTSGSKAQHNGPPNTAGTARDNSGLTRQVHALLPLPRWILWPALLRSVCAAAFVTQGMRGGQAQGICKSPGGAYCGAFSSLSPREGLRPAPTQSRQRAGGEGPRGSCHKAPHPNPLPEGRAPVKLGVGRKRTRPLLAVLALCPRSGRGRGHEPMMAKSPLSPVAWSNVVLFVHKQPRR